MASFTCSQVGAAAAGGASPFLAYRRRSGGAPSSSLFVGRRLAATPAAVRMRGGSRSARGGTALRVTCEKVVGIDLGTTNSAVAAMDRNLKCRRAGPLAPAAAAAAAGGSSPSSAVFHGEVFVVGDNIDTDQIIPAEHLTLVPSKPDEYRKLGSFAFSGLPSAAYSTPFVAPEEESSRYAVIVGGANFGCGSSREHAPVALGAAGARAVVAESYARIFFRNSVATGEVYPLELADAGAWKECKTGDVVTVDLGNSVFINHTSGKEYKLKPIGDAGPVIEAGGIFAYARKTGMIASKAAA